MKRECVLLLCLWLAGAQSRQSNDEGNPVLLQVLPDGLQETHTLGQPSSTDHISSDQSPGSDQTIATDHQESPATTQNTADHPQMTSDHSTDPSALPIDDGDHPIDGDQSHHDEASDAENALLNATDHPDHSNGSDHKKHHGHHDIHVASWNYEYVQKPLLISVFIIVISLIKVLFHHCHRLSEVVPESCLLIVLGVIIGFLFLIEHAQEELKFVHFNSQTFFLYLLPPIILEAAYSLRDRAFAENLGTIMLYAVVGTILNIMIVGPCLYGIYMLGFMGPNLHMQFLECLIWSAVVAAVDPVAVLAIFQDLGVNKTLYFMVFGESLFNDAVTVVVYNMIVSLMQIDQIGIRDMGLGLAAFLCVSLGGMFIGFFCGFLTAFMTKYTTKVRVVEPIILFGSAYLSYLAAELFHFSGIISIICCGLIQSHYAVENISSKSYISIHYFSKVAAGVTESLIFIILGVMLVNDYKSWLDANAAFIVCGLVLVLASRFIVVFVLAYWVNRYMVGIRKINKQEQFIMAYGGLRGAITFSLIFMLDPAFLDGEKEKKNLLLTASYVIVFFTTFLQGITIKPLVKIMRIRLQATDSSIFREVHRAVLENTMAGIEEILGHKGTHFWQAKTRQLSRRFLRPLVQRHPQKKGTKLVAAYQEVEIQRQLSHISSEVSIPKPATLMTELEAYDSLDMPNIVSDARLDAHDDHYQAMQKQQEKDRKAKASRPSLKLESATDLLALRDMLQHTPNKTMHYVFDPNLSYEDKNQKNIVDSIRNMAAVRRRSLFKKGQKREQVRMHIMGSALLPLGMGMGLAQARVGMDTIDETGSIRADEDKHEEPKTTESTMEEGTPTQDDTEVDVKFVKDERKKKTKTKKKEEGDEVGDESADETDPLC